MVINERVNINPTRPGVAQELPSLWKISPLFEAFPNKKYMVWYYGMV